MHVRFIPLIVAAALTIATLPVAAHHGWAGNGEEEFNLTGTGGIFPQLPAINAWRAADPSVVLTNIDVPNDGRLIIGCRSQ